MSVLYAALGTLHWPIAGDAPPLHYATFLFDHGMQPYTQVVEMDLPGVYAFAWSARHLLGESALAWRAADFLLIAFCWLACIAIARGVRRDAWPAGFFAGALFTLLHFRDGPPNTCQRDLLMTALLLPATAALLYAANRLEPRAHNAETRRPSLLAPLFFAGVFFGAACTIKPQAILFAIVLTALTLYKLRPMRVLDLFALLDGFLLPVATMLLWLHHHHAVRAFFATMSGLAAYHASLGRISFGRLLIGSFPTVLLAVAIPACLLLAVTKPWRTLAGQLLLAATACGCISYISQGKGFPYHRYPTEAFLLLFIALLAFEAAHLATWHRYLALATFMIGAFFLAPVSAHIADGFSSHDEFRAELTGDLEGLSRKQHIALDHSIQCFDNTAGCVSTLDAMQLTQATGFLYDCYALQPAHSSYQDRYRAAFLAQLTAANPRVLVVTNQDCFTLTRSFDRLSRWPQLDTWLAAHYTLTGEVTPPHLVAWWPKPQPPFSYRIYLRHD
jgi:hypothetical protein